MEEPAITASLEIEVPAVDELVPDAAVVSDKEEEEDDEEQYDAFNNEPEKAAHSELESLSRQIEEAENSRELLQNKKNSLQQSVLPLLSQKKHNAEKLFNPIESEKRYVECLNTIRDNCSSLQKSQAQYDRIAMDLQSRLDEKEYKANEISESFTEFKREIAKGAENSRTGKSIPQKVISSFEVQEAKKDEEVEKVRLKNINLRTQVRKLEIALKAKEQLAEGLHLIDFEQLKIENQTLNQKIEERNEELHKLRKKTTDTVQVLTHIKEKLQFVLVENYALKTSLSNLDDTLTANREVLTSVKKQRDSLRSNNASLKQKVGFANSSLLKSDFENRSLDLEALHNKKSECVARLLYLNQLL